MPHALKISQGHENQQLISIRELKGTQTVLYVVLSWLFTRSWVCCFLWPPSECDFCILLHAVNQNAKSIHWPLASRKPRSSKFGSVWPFRVAHVSCIILHLQNEAIFCAAQLPQARLHIYKVSQNCEHIHCNYIAKVWQMYQGRKQLHRKNIKLRSIWNILALPATIPCWPEHKGP